MHYLNCTHGDHLNTRHEVVTKATHEMVQSTAKHSATKGLENVLEGFKNKKGNRLVLDQLVRGFGINGTDVGIDFAICNPCATTYLQAAKTKSLQPLSSGAEAKSVSTTSRAKPMTLNSARL